MHLIESIMLIKQDSALDAARYFDGIGSGQFPTRMDQRACNQAISNSKTY
jgi:hypothetical protein